jgi:hypothetical protein
MAAPDIPTPTLPDAQPSGRSGLARHTVGLPGVLFQSVTFMAPGAAVATSLAVAAGFAGGALPLSIILTMIAAVIVASSIGQLAKHLPAIGTVILIPVLAAAVGVGSSVLKFVSPLPYPISEAGLVVGIWFLIGLIYLAYLLRRHPERVHDMDKVFD